MSNIRWRYKNRGDGQPGPEQTVYNNGSEVVVNNILPDTDIEINLSETGGEWVDKKTLVFNLPEDRVPAVKTSSGGRPNVFAASYYFDGQDEFIDPLTHRHISGITHIGVKDGFWDDPTVWNAGTVPGQGAKVSTGDFWVKYRGQSDVILDYVTVPLKGRLTWDDAADTRMRLYYGMSMGPVEQDDPNESTTLGKRKHEVIFHPVHAPGASVELGWMFMGPTRLRGARKLGRLRLGTVAPDIVPTLLAGATEVYLPGLAESGWREQDDIVIGASDYIAPSNTDPDYLNPTSWWGYNRGEKQNNEAIFQFSQNEQRKIISIDGDYVTLDRALDHNHVAQKRTLFDGKIVMVAPVVGNPCRNICFRTASFEQDGVIDPTADLAVAQKRAHLMFMRCAEADRRYVETQNMGRTEVDVTLTIPETFPYQVEMAGGVDTIHPILNVQGGTPLANPNNVRGRYAWHDHHIDGTFSASEIAYAVGCTAWAPDWAPPIPGWAIVQHGTRAHYEDVLAINFRGSGLQTELGTETGQWIGCTAMGGRGDGGDLFWGNKNEVYTNLNDSTGIGFANQSRAIFMDDCVAVGVHYGFVWHAQKTNKVKRATRYEDLRFSDPMTKNSTLNPALAYYDEGYGVENVQIPPFNRNEVHASKVGLKVVHRGGDGRKHETTPMLVEEFHCLGVTTAVSITEYSNRYYFKHCLWYNTPAFKTDTQCAQFGNVTWGWCVSLSHFENYTLAIADTGMGVNYEGHFIDNTMTNVDNFANYTVINVAGINQHQSRNVMGDWEEIGTNSAIIRRHRNESSADLPTPYPLAPYGLKLPVNDPNGNPYPIVHPGDTPYFVLGDGTNGSASPNISLNLGAGFGRDQGSVYGVIRDSVGDRRTFTFMTSESFPQGAAGAQPPRNFDKVQPEQVIQRVGCWNDNGVWKARTWMRDADRFTHVRFSYYIDWTLTGFPAGLLAAHDIGGPPAAPGWPDKVEVTPKSQRPLFKKPKTLKFLSRVKLEAVLGQPLAHRLRPNVVSSNLTIVGGANADDFEVFYHQTLRWIGDAVTAGSGTKEVLVRAEDVWGNSVETLHQIRILPSTALDLIADDFNRADELLTARPGYTLLAGTNGCFAVRSNRLAVIDGSGSLVQLGQLSSSDVEINVGWIAHYHQIMFRMVDANNYMVWFVQLYGLGSELGMVVNGVYSKIAEFANLTGQYFKLIANERRVSIRNSYGDATSMFPRGDMTGLLTPFEFNELSAPGVYLLPANAPMGTKVGVRSQGDITNPWIDDLSFRAIK